MSTSQAHLQCLCKAVYEPGTLLAAKKFPIETEFCHCNVCRRVNGGLGGTFAPLKGAPSEKSLAACTKYARPGLGKVERYFCNTCGGRVFDCLVGDGSEEPKWFACSGIIEAEGVDNVVKVMQHAYVSDTGDGGIVQKIRHLGSRDVECYEQACGSGESPLTAEQVDKIVYTREIPFPTLHNLVQVSCHCEAIKFKLLRPDSSRNDIARAQRWLRANNTKYMARVCVCRSCRLSLGFSLVTFTYAPAENIVTEDGALIFNYSSRDSKVEDIDSVQTLQKALPNLISFISSPGEVRRSSCGKCGALIFYENKRRPQAVDIAAGLLRSPVGALAEDWLVWEWAEVACAEEAVDKELFEALQR